MNPDPARFYTGLVAQLYEPLVSYRAMADEYAPFLDRAGTPALEPCCGTGVPLLELLARGCDVEGLDCPADMDPTGDSSQLGRTRDRRDEGGARRPA